MKIGLKLYTTDTAYIPEAVTLREKKIFDYIELYAVPLTYEKTIRYWKESGCNFVIHAPHTAHGVNLADIELRSSNLIIYSEVKKFCDDLNSPYIIVHGGSNGTLAETIHQLKMINDERIRLENKPLKGLNGEVCRGSSPEEIAVVYELVKLKGITLDFGHAIYYSTSCNLDYRKTINAFTKFAPSLFHISDGIYDSHTDVHLNIGSGNFNIKELLNYLNEESMLSIETPRFCKDNLCEFIEDVRRLRMLV